MANSKLVYERFGQLFAAPRWQRLAAAGAKVQRVLWASTGTKNPAYSDVLYVDELIGPHTVNTLPEATLAAFRDHGTVRRTVDAAPTRARRCSASWPRRASTCGPSARSCRPTASALRRAFDGVVRTVDEKRRRELLAGAGA